jgi:hypothetical protein
MEIKLITKNTNVPNSRGKIVDRGNIDPHKIQIHDCLYIYIELLSWLRTGTSIKSGRVKLFAWTQNFPLLVN